MICYVLAMGKQHVGLHVVVGYGIKISWLRLFITSPDNLDNNETYNMRGQNPSPPLPIPLFFTCQTLGT